jgi:hypothetical protein
LAASFAACTGEKAPAKVATPAATAGVVSGSQDTVVARSIEALWNTESARGLKELLAYSPIVVIGTVEDVSFDRERLLNEDLSDYPTVEGKPLPPKGTIPSYSTTLYRVRVEDSFVGPQAPDEIVLVYQWGGEVSKADGTIERWTIEGDAPLQRGEKYLLFLTQAPGRSGQLVAAPWGKYRVTDRIELLDAQWASQGVAKDLTSRAVSDVPAAIIEARAR